MVVSSWCELPPGPGRPEKLGATATGNGVNFAVFSAFAERVEICLFSDDGTEEVVRIALPERTGDIWHGHLTGIGPGIKYGLRVHGPHAPESGHRFNANKLLLDPYAQRIVGCCVQDDAIYGYIPGNENADLTFDCRDSAHAVPRSVVANPEQKQHFSRPCTPWDRTVIYEAHPRGLTMLHPHVPDHLRGTFAGLATDPILEHLTQLGVTAIELLPVQAHLNEPCLTRRGLTNYWGYNTIGFFAPEPRYLGSDGIEGFRSMVRRFHAAGIEVILDVVYNHTGEGSEQGPTVSFRGLDNASYYRLNNENPRFSVNDTGCGNTLDLSHPMVLRLVMDSLRYWTAEMGVDGFRFDLATTLGREENGFSAGADFFVALRQDPALAGVKLIAEPWDVGPGGYQLGGFPTPFAEWNDVYRDSVRRYWRGCSEMAPDLAARLLGSAERFDHGGRRPWSTVNFITSHDGFTLNDLVSYECKRNQANGEDNRDGHDPNHSSNCGVEGPTPNPVVNALRAQRMRNLMATLLLSQGTPMLLAGDEFGNSQAGNNNAYCQDNPLGWVDWTGEGKDFHRFVARLVELRARHPVLRQAWFLHGDVRERDGHRDAIWFGEDGHPPNWHEPGLCRLGLMLRLSADAPAHAESDDAIFIVLNSGSETEFTLPDPGVAQWMRTLDSIACDGGADQRETASAAKVSASSIVVFSLRASSAIP